MSDNVLIWFNGAYPPRPEDRDVVLYVGPNPNPENAPGVRSTDLVWQRSAQHPGFVIEGTDSTYTLRPAENVVWKDNTWGAGGNDT